MNLQPGGLYVIFHQAANASTILILISTLSLGHGAAPLCGAGVAIRRRLRTRLFLMLNRRAQSKDICLTSK
jgi:hypothetical protein